MVNGDKRQKNVQKVKGGHYIAAQDYTEPPYAHANRGYSTDGEESHKAISERAPSEYTVS